MFPWSFSSISEPIWIKCRGTRGLSIILSQNTTPCYKYQWLCRHSATSTFQFFAASSFFAGSSTKMHDAHQPPDHLRSLPSSIFKSYSFIQLIFSFNNYLILISYKKRIWIFRRSVCIKIAHFCHKKLIPVKTEKTFTIREASWQGGEVFCITSLIISCTMV